MPPPAASGVTGVLPCAARSEWDVAGATVTRSPVQPTRRRSQSAHMLGHSRLPAPTLSERKEKPRGRTEGGGEGGGGGGGEGGGQGEGAARVLPEPRWRRAGVLLSDRPAPPHSPDRSRWVWPTPRGPDMVRRGEQTAWDPARARSGLTRTRGRRSQREQEANHEGAGHGEDRHHGRREPPPEGRCTHGA